ncbi:MAG: hypothetical protein V7646_4043, partial [Pseudonocardia sp.]
LSRSAGATRRSREDRAAGKLACRRASLDWQADLRLDPIVLLENRSYRGWSKIARLVACRSPDQKEILMASDARAPINLYIAAPIRTKPEAIGTPSSNSPRTT